MRRKPLFGAFRGGIWAIRDHMKRLAAIHLLILATISQLASPVLGVVIDDFSVGSASVCSFDPVDQTGLDANHVLGGARRIDISSYGGGSQVLSIESDQLQFSSAGWGYFDVTYGAAQPLGVDLTQGGHDRLLIRFGEVGPGFHPFGAYVSLPTNSSSNGESMYIQDSWDGLLVEIPYSRFPVSFTNVSSITLHAVRNPAGSGFAIESVILAGPPWTAITIAMAASTPQT